MGALSRAAAARRIAADWLVLAAVSHVRETGKLKCRMFMYSTAYYLFGRQANPSCSYFRHITLAMDSQRANTEVWDKQIKARWCKMVGRRVAAVVQGCSQSKQLGMTSTEQELAEEISRAMPADERFRVQCPL